jgi:hypothetical protein
MGWDGMGRYTHAHHVEYYTHRSLQSLVVYLCSSTMGRGLKQDETKGIQEHAA